jgi:L-lactate dehydrogenase complex protein LldG
MSSDRDQVLGDLRLALQAGHTAPADSAAAAVAPAWRQVGRLARGDAIALLTERAEEYGAVVRFASSTGLAETLAAELAAAGVRRVVIPVDIPSSWRVGGVDWVEDRGLDASEPTRSTVWSPGARSPSPKRQPSCWTAPSGRGVAP